MLSVGITERCLCNEKDSKNCEVIKQKKRFAVTKIFEVQDVKICQANG